MRYPVFFSNHIRKTAHEEGFQKMLWFVEHKQSVHTADVQLDQLEVEADFKKLQELIFY